MANRLNKRQADSARSLIKTQRIIQELQRHIHDEREMTATQIRAAEILLKKSIPDIQSISMDLEADVGVNVTIGSFVEPTDG